MNGYGHFVPALFWSMTYWIVHLRASSGWSRSPTRAAAPTIPSRARTRLALRRAPRLAPAAALPFLAAVGSGIWYYYNAHVLNEYLTAKDRRAIQARV